MPVPPPPVPWTTPGTHSWPAAKTIRRVYDHSLGSTESNPTDVSRRFRPVFAEGSVVPTIYGSDEEDGAICETVFHDVSLSDPAPSILRAALLPLVLSPISPQRELKLAALTDPHIKALKVTHADLIETDAAQYSETVPWAQAIYDDSAGFDGIVWHSRQHHGTLTTLLWANRVDRFGDLAADPTTPPLPLYHGYGFAKVAAVASAMNVTITL